MDEATAGPGIEIGQDVSDQLEAIAGLEPNARAAALEQLELKLRTTLDSISTA